jgi:hypothetical protein
MFTGRYGEVYQTLSQIIDVSSLASQIDNNLIEYQFSILMQARQTGSLRDTAETTLSFHSGSGVVLGSEYFFDPLVDGVYDWATYGNSSLLPTGTRSIEILLVNQRLGGGSSSDGYFDDVSLSVNVVPEPVSSVLFITGAGIMGFRRFFKRGLK